VAQDKRLVVPVIGGLVLRHNHRQRRVMAKITTVMAASTKGVTVQQARRAPVVSLLAIASSGRKHVLLENGGTVEEIFVLNLIFVTTKTTTVMVRSMKI
tara:strand:+ start:5741 stop:6037 length:297 start_codon:yes stop_codon:yes gene_type:complete